MASNIVELVIRGTDNSARAIASSVKNLQGLDSALSAVSRQLAGIVSVGALVTLAKSAIDLGSSLSDMSEKFGVSASDLSALSYPAKMVGVELEGVGNAFKFMQKSIAEASNTTSDQAIALKLLGVSLTDLKGKTPTEQFLRLADAFSRLEKDENRTAIALAVFGRAGADILPILDKGGAGLKEMMDAAKAMGAALSEEEIKKLDHYGDVIDLIGIRAKATAGRGLVELIEKIKAVGETAAKYGPAIEGVIYNMGLMDEIGPGARKFKAPPLPEPPPKVKAGSIEDEKDKKKKADDAAKKSEREAEQREKEAFKRKIGLLSDYGDALSMFYGDAAEISKILGEEDIARSEKAVKLEKDRADYAEDLRGTMDMLSTYDPEMDLAEGLANIGNIVKEVSPEIQRMMDEWYQKTYALADLYATVFRGEDGVIADFANVAIDAFHGMTAALTDFVMNGKMRFHDFANAVIADLVRIAMQQAVVGPIAQGFMTALGFTPPARAYGGPVSAGSAYMVGERGPELFFPSTSGNIVPGGGVGNVTVNVVNKTGGQIEKRNIRTSFDSAQGMVIDMVIDGAIRNVGGLGTLLGRA